MQLTYRELPDLARTPVFARRGVVATSQPLASQAGLAVLMRGGNAVDAALAAAITLTVVEPSSNGVGGDTFALVWDGKALHGLNGSGRAPAAHTIEAIKAQGYQEMPDYGWPSVTVPGTPAAWRDLHQKFGKLPFATLFETAITYAEEGYPVAPTSWFNWRWQVDKVQPDLHGDEYSGFAPIFTIDGRAPHIGEIWRNPAMARTLRLIADSDANAFYQGSIAEAIIDFAAQTGGLLTADDLAQHSSTWVTPISTSYRGYDVWEIPPNGQGLAALIALNILEGYDLATIPRESAYSYHLQVEAMKLAYTDAFRYIADPAFTNIPLAELLSKDYAKMRRALIGDQAGVPAAGEPVKGGTVYLSATDADGMMVSLIQSNYGGFGSHVVIPTLGICLQNRGGAFSLDASHPNHLEPGKRPYHTIIPGFLTQNGEAIGPFGVMGGHMQPQGHVQMIVNTVDYHMNPQASLDAPRWFCWIDRYLKLEPTVPPDVVAGLTERGHEIEVDPEIDAFGRGQVIWRLPSGVYVAGSEPRADGYAAAY